MSKETIKLAADCKKCPKEAMDHFVKGDSHDINKEYTKALKEYNLALKLGYVNIYDLCQTMIVAGINMGLLEQITSNGIPNKKTLDEPISEETKESLDILEDAINKSKKYLR